MDCDMSLNPLESKTNVEIIRFRLVIVVIAKPG